MKSLLIFITTCITFNNYAQTTFNISGTLIGKDTGAIVLWYTDANNQGISDTTLITQGKFSFSGQVLNATEGLIWTDLSNIDLDHHTVIRFIIEPRNISITKTVGDSFAIITGSYAQKEKDNYDAKKAEAIKQLPTAEKTGNLRQYLADMDIAWLAKHPQSHVAAYLLDRRVTFMPLDSAMHFYEALADSVRNSSLGYRILRHVYPLTNDQVFRNRYPLIDQAFTRQLAAIRSIHDLSLNDSSGKSVGLARFKGKYLLIGAWASWCKPCIRNIPTWNSLVKQYDPKRIQFVTVSMNKEVKDWKNALRTHQPAGLPLIDTNSFLGLFAVYSKVLWVGKYIMVDPNGRILNYDLDAGTEAEWRSLIDSYIK